MNKCFLSQSALPFFTWGGWIAAKTTQQRQLTFLKVITVSALLISNSHSLGSVTICWQLFGAKRISVTYLKLICHTHTHTRLTIAHWCLRLLVFTHLTLRLLLCTMEAQDIWQSPAKKGPEVVVVVGWGGGRESCHWQLGDLRSDHLKMKKEKTY